MIGLVCVALAAPLTYAAYRLGVWSFRRNIEREYLKEMGL